MSFKTDIFAPSTLVQHLLYRTDHVTGVLNSSSASAKLMRFMLSCVWWSEFKTVRGFESRGVDGRASDQWWSEFKFQTMLGLSGVAVWWTKFKCLGTVWANVLIVVLLGS